MGVIVLHAGMAKAGSSSIQQWLANNTDVLATEREIHPLRIVRGSSDGAFDVVGSTASRVKSLLVGVQAVAPPRRRDPSLLRAEAAQLFDRLDLVAQTHETIVLTSEGYQLPFWRGDESFLAQLDELARKHCVRVAYYVRPQHTAIEAAWRQWGFRLPFTPSQYVQRKVPEVRFLETFEQVSELAPHVSFEMRAFRDDLLEGGDVVTDFATTFLGAEDLVAAAGDEGRLNRGLPLELVMLLRDGKGRFWASAHDNETLDQLRDAVTRWEIPESEQVRRSRRVLQAFCRRCFEPSNQRLIETLGWDTSHFVPPLDDAAEVDADRDLEALDELWSSTPPDALRELVFCALSELLGLPQHGREGGQPRDRDGRETDVDPTC